MWLYPDTAARRGLLKCNLVGPIGPWEVSAGSKLGGPTGRLPVVGEEPMVWRSKPAQKVPFAPYRIATLASGSASKARKAAYSLRAVEASTALRR